MATHFITRRSFVAQGAGAVASTVAPSFLRDVKPKISPAMVQLSNYMANATKTTLPNAVVEQTQLHILDTLAAMISGAELEPGIAALKFAKQYGGEHIATIVATSLLSSPIEAALTNGMLAHSDETDDSHAPSQSHPGCAIIPAAMAVGEMFNITGAHFLQSVALGYDVGCRITMAFGGSKYQIDTHRATHSIAGEFGSAAAAASCAGLNAQQMRWVLDYAGQQSSGVASWQRDVDHIEKAFTFGGMPAKNGALSALVVASGWTGVDDIFSGADNFILANDPTASADKFVEALGVRYEVMQTNIKKWCVGSPIQAPLDAMEFLKESRKFAANEVKRVIVSVGSEEAGVVDNRDLPDICLQHLVALMLVDGTVTFKSAHDRKRMQDPAVLAQRAKVELIPSEELQKELPKRVAIVEIAFQNGDHVSKRIDAVRGTAENPMTASEVIAKAQSLIKPVLGAVKVQKITDAVLHLNNSEPLKYLMSLLTL